MKIANQPEGVRASFVVVCVAAAALILGTPVTSTAINSVAPAVAAVAQDTSTGPETTPLKLAPGVADILKMMDAKVDPEVIETYVRNSSAAFNPSAAEIIALKNRGVGPEILTAMLQRDGELRAQAARPYTAAPGSAAAPAAPAAVNPYAPVYEYSAQPAYPAYTYTYPAASYVYPSYSYGYPGYYYGGYNCGYSWPWYWPSFYFGGYPYRGYCGYPYYVSGYRYPYCYGGRGIAPYCGNRGYYGAGAYYGRGAHYGSRGYFGGAGHYRAGGYSGVGGRPAPYAGQRAGFRSPGGGARPATFARAPGGFRSVGGFSSRPASFSGMRGGSRAVGGFGGRSMGRGR